MRPRPIDGVAPDKTEDDIAREQLGPRGVPGAPNPARMVLMGPMMSSLPSERHAAELMLLSVVNA